MYKFLFLSDRSTNLLQINTMLREQLDQAHLANQQLTEDLRRTTTELQQIRNDFTQKSRDWKEEERVEF
jgi:rootletin